MDHVLGFREALDSVARERAYLAQVEAPSLEWASSFVAKNIQSDYAQFVAIDSGAVVGWCDIIPSSRPGFGHSGTVGMGVIKGWRHKGLGKALLDACLQKSRKNGLTRIELEVYASNQSAIALYNQFGFVPEGFKRRARFLDGEYQDLVVMALLFDATKPTLRRTLLRGTAYLFRHLLQ